MSNTEFFLRFAWAKCRANFLAFMPKYWGWHVCEITETGPAGNAAKVWLVRFGRGSQAPILDKRLIARIVK